MNVLRALPLVLLLSACPSPQEKCVPELIGENGELPRFNVSGMPMSPPLGSVGLPQRLMVFAPLSVCERDFERISVSVELLGPDNFDVPDVTISPAQHVRASAESGAPPEPVEAVFTEVSFTPALPGQYLMRASFEPQLGTRSFLVDVAEPRIDPPSVRVTVPSWNACVDQPWALSADAVACERSAKNVEIYFSDGGVTSFPGEQLVVAGPVLWSVVSATSQLERHKLVDGGVVLTDVFSGFSARTVRGMHDERSALRSTNSGTLMLAAIESPLIDLGSQSNVATDRLLFVDNERLFTAIACELEGCFGLRGLDPEMVWTIRNQGTGVSGNRRPLEFEGQPEDVLFRRRVALARPPPRGFERMPMWVPLGAGLSALVNSDRLGFGFTAWKDEDVIRVGKHYVLLNGQNDVLRVTPR